MCRWYGSAFAKPTNQQPCIDLCAKLLLLLFCTVPTVCTEPAQQQHKKYISLFIQLWLWVCVYVFGGRRRWNVTEKWSAEDVMDAYKAKNGIFKVSKVKNCVQKKIYAHILRPSAYSLLPTVSISSVYFFSLQIDTMTQHGKCALETLSVYI